VTAPPGLVDLQVNGHRGVDFASATLELDDVLRAADQLDQAGTEGFLATVVTAPPGVYRRNLPLLARAVEQTPEDSGVLGIHLEGPFLSPEPGYVGAHNPDWILPGQPGLLDELLDLAAGQVRLVTLAAETHRCDDLARLARHRGAAVAVGHSRYTPDDLSRLHDAGATLLTHVGNGLPNELDRHDNPIVAALADDRYTAMVIPDGFHLPPALLKVILRAKTPARVIAVSDASSLTGMAPGEYESFASRVVLEPSGKLHIPSRACLAGSARTLAGCAEHLASLDLLSDDDLARITGGNAREALAG
jgi:N-acetylglucosamine-6-phosphate deacetylase